MRLQYKLTFQDFLAAQALHSKRSALSRINFLGPIYLFPIIGLGFIAWAKLLHATGASMATLVGAGVYLLVCPFLVRSRYKRLFHRTRSTDEPSTIDFNDQMIRCQGPHSKGELEWAAVQSFSEDDRTLILYLAPGKFLCIPKRVCDAAQVESLRAMFQDKIETATS